jgi:hypothetical protein
VSQHGRTFRRRMAANRLRDCSGDRTARCGDQLGEEEITAGRPIVMTPDPTNLSSESDFDSGGWLQVGAASIGRHPCRSARSSRRNTKKLPPPSPGWSSARLIGTPFSLHISSAPTAPWATMAMLTGGASSKIPSIAPTIRAWASLAGFHPFTLRSGVPACCSRPVP